MRIVIYKTILDEDRKPSLFKEKAINYDTSESNLSNPYSVVKLINHLFNGENLTEEYMWMIALNIKGRPVGIFEISHGTVSSSLVSVRETLTRLCLLGAVGFILVHNHPSGSASPSEDDITTTMSLKEGATIIGCTLVDHIIITNEDGYFSFRENSYLDK